MSLSRSFEIFVSPLRWGVFSIQGCWKIPGAGQMVAICAIFLAQGEPCMQCPAGHCPCPFDQSATALVSMKCKAPHSCWNQILVLSIGLYLFWFETPTVLWSDATSASKSGRAGFYFYVCPSKFTPYASESRQVYRIQPFIKPYAFKTLLSLS